MDNRRRVCVWPLLPHSYHKKPLCVCVCVLDYTHWNVWTRRIVLRSMSNEEHLEALCSCALRCLFFRVRELWCHGDAGRRCGESAKEKSMAGSKSIRNHRAGSIDSSSSLPWKSELRHFRPRKWGKNPHASMFLAASLPANARYTWNVQKSML